MDDAVGGGTAYVAAENAAVHLPLSLSPSQVVPPSPTRHASAIDFLPDFGGAAWLAYGAASFLIISHVPSPSSKPNSDPSAVGPFFRQVIEPHRCAAAAAACERILEDTVTSVAWRPSSPSEGELAATFGDCVGIYCPEVKKEPGCFFWRQTCGILQSFTVEAIKWTGSGDGLIVAGTEVILWARNTTCWEVVWKSRSEVPQCLVSACFFAEGPVATAPGIYGKNFSLSRAESSRVTVYQSDGRSCVTEVYLSHPQPVLMIQWRPTYSMHVKMESSHPWRDMLMTCCLDGTVRLWSEIDNGRTKKHSKELHDQKSSGRSFHVITVIEVNQCLKGALGMDIFVSWAWENGSVISKSEGNTFELFENAKNDNIGRCEWLVSVGPKSLVTFWALHCLDDISPLRFPRVTIWKKCDLEELKHQKFDLATLVKIVVSRSQLFGPPVLCSLLLLLSDNSFSWADLGKKIMNGHQEGSSPKCNEEQCLQFISNAVLNLDCHSGKILHFAVHPYSSEIELAVSLDCSGFLFFWSFSMISSLSLGMQAYVNPTYQLLGKVRLHDFSPDVVYSCLKWAPSVLGDQSFLLLGHADGIDCLIVSILGDFGNVLCQKILTIPFSGYGNLEAPPDQIFASPISSKDGPSFTSCSFLVFAVWLKNFQAFSWKVALHSENSSGSSNFCGCDGPPFPNLKEGGSPIHFAGKAYTATVFPASTEFPGSGSSAQVNSFAALASGYSFLSFQHNKDGLSTKSIPFHFATGFLDGTLKLWRISHSESSSWELAGEFTAHQGPVDAVCLSSYGNKIATIGKGEEDSITSIRIWEAICHIGSGGFLLEDMLTLKEPVSALDWACLGNGQLLLGVCTRNELRVYADRRYTDSNDTRIWVCIALSQIHLPPQDFLWGPKLLPILLHKNTFTVFSPWLFISKKQKFEAHPIQVWTSADRAPSATCSISSLYADEISAANAILEAKGADFCSACAIHSACSMMSNKGFHFYRKNGLCKMIDLTNYLYRPLPAYHPKALLEYLYSGNKKRAYVVLKHLVQCITSTDSSVLEVDLSAYFAENNSEDVHGKEPQMKGLQWGQDTLSGNLPYQTDLYQFREHNKVAFVLENTSTTLSLKSEIVDLKNMLEKCDNCVSLKDVDIDQVVAIMELIAEVSESPSNSVYEILDEPGRRFWVAVRFQKLYSVRKCGRSASSKDLIANSTLIAWAFHSECQGDLFSSLLPAEPSWVEMRNLGVGYWFTNLTQLRTQMEKLARCQYLQRKDPKECALLYLALNRIQVLAGLFKISKDEKDKVLFGFLSRNFQEEKNKAAALKNAYVLMGRHQLELASAFFLLGGDFSSAVTVCAKNLGDAQLALVLCRLLEGYGGPLESQLISSFLLPNALEKGDYWLCSMLEWLLGNYSRSVKHLVDSYVETKIERPRTLCSRAAFLDPNIGHYCMLLASKNSLRNSIGDYLASTTFKFASFMAAKALSRCGLPLLALECFSSLCSMEVKDLGIVSYDIGSHEIFEGLLKPYARVDCNWLLGQVASDLDTNKKLNMALVYIAHLLSNQPCSLPAHLTSPKLVLPNKNASHQADLRMEERNNCLKRAILLLKKKYSLEPNDLAAMALIFACNSGSLFLGFQWLQNYLSQEHENDGHKVGSHTSNPLLPRLIIKASLELSNEFAKFVAYNSYAKLDSNSGVSVENEYAASIDIFLDSLLYLINTMKYLLQPYGCGSLIGGPSPRTVDVLIVLEYFIHFASNFLKGNLKGLIMMMRPVLTAPANDQSPFEVIAGELLKLVNSEETAARETDAPVFSVSSEEYLFLVGVSLWLNLATFAVNQLGKSFLTATHEAISSPMNLSPILSARSLINSIFYVSSSLTKQFASYLRRELLKGGPLPTLEWLGQSSQPSKPFYLDQENEFLQFPGNLDCESILKILCETSPGQKEICQEFVSEKVSCFPYNGQRCCGSWQYIQKHVSRQHDNSDLFSNQTEGSLSPNSKNDGAGLLSRNLASDTSGFLETKRRDSIKQTRTPFFCNPKEVFKRTGELFEAISFNAIDEQQAALLSNKKGLVFFNLMTKETVIRHPDYIWPEAEWPQGGWASCESTPIPTVVSPGVGLGSKKGAHLGLGGATVGVWARPGKDLTGGGAFGIPGYAGIGASGLGWGVQEEFDDYGDPPPTRENIRSRALARHPSRSFFLVGSSNTHIYLWEFGKDTATATYGILPAANVPPPYALASVSALQFDHCGQRFASANLDGTVCTWQLEVGGKTNVHPSDSSICFSNHASDVAYLGTSSSVLAAAGCSSNGANVIVWDTLAPPSTSQASMVCHEGGARSLSVFDNDLGTSSISPLIVTGGKNGDLGLHDFRFIATGKTKRHRQSTDQDIRYEAVQDAVPGTTPNSGENVNGMIWYLPKAHLGSVTRISAIPGTGLFLTGSKDGDVKLWDAKRCELVFHWHKMHDRHTFLQPNSRGFGGVVRAAVTDIQVFSNGFLTCGGDGSVKMVHLN